MHQRRREFVSQCLYGLKSTLSVTETVLHVPQRVSAVTDPSHALLVLLVTDPEKTGEVQFIGAARCIFHIDSRWRPGGTHYNRPGCWVDFLGFR